MVARRYMCFDQCRYRLRPLCATKLSLGRCFLDAAQDEGPPIIWARPIVSGGEVLDRQRVADIGLGQTAWPHPIPQLDEPASDLQPNGVPAVHNIFARLWTVECTQLPKMKAGAADQPGPFSTSARALRSKGIEQDQQRDFLAQCSQLARCFISCGPIYAPATKGIGPMRLHGPDGPYALA